MTSLKTPQEYNIALVLDNDECIGAWSIASAIYNIFADYIPKNTGIKVSECLRLFKDCLIKNYFSKGGARPGTKETLKMIKKFKDNGSINSVLMFTSSPNRNEWVNFLKDCLEQYADVKGLYDYVLHRENTYSKISADGATIKCLNMVRNKIGLVNSKVIIIDDRPHNVSGEGVRIAVTPYRHVVNADNLYNLIDDMLNNLQDIYKPITGVKTYQPNSFRKILKDVIIYDPNGISKEINDNRTIHSCPVDQMDDTNLIKNGIMMFINHIKPTRMNRTLSDELHIPYKKLSKMKRSLSVN